MRILHLDCGREMRGGQWQALLLARWLARQGHVCEFLAPPNTLLRGEWDREGRGSASATLLNVFRRSPAFDILHCHDARSHSLCALAARRPFVVSRRVGFPVGRGMANRWKYSRAAAYLAVSAYAGHQLRQAGVPAGRIYLVPDAVPVPATMGSLDGPLVAIESEDPGKGTALLRQTGLPIVFTRELLSVLPSARALLYISDMEGLGSGALLSLAWGVPVIASRVGGLPEIVRHEETGLLVENHPAAIAQAASRLIEDRTLAERLGRNGRRMVEESFTLEAMAEKTLECYRQVLG